MKSCRTCGVSKAEADFNRHARAADGLSSSCRECDHVRQRAYRQAHPEKQREWEQANRTRMLEHGRRWQQGNRPKKAIHRRVQYAISTGRLTRPDACSMCGRTGRIEGHHDDYGRPLDVRWLCSACHHVEHPRAA